MPKSDKDRKPITVSDIALKTMKGDIRQVIVDRWRAQKKLFSSLSENEQRDEIGFADDLAAQIVRRVVSLVVAHEFPTVAITMTGQFGVKDGLVTIKATCPASADNLVKIARDGSAVLVIADAHDFSGQRAATKPDPDQTSILEDETDDERQRREARERQAFDESEQQRKAAESAVRQAHLEEVRRKGFDAYEDDQEPVVPEEFAGDDEASKEYLDAWQAAADQAAKFRGSKKRKKGGEPGEAEAA